MRDWSVVTWIGLSIVFLIAVTYYIGFSSDTQAAAGALGSTVQALTGRAGGQAPAYAK